MQGHIPYGINYGEIPIPPMECNPPPIALHPPIIPPMNIMPPRMPPGTFYPPIGMPPSGDLYHTVMYNVVSPPYTSPAPPYMEQLPNFSSPLTTNVKDNQKLHTGDMNLGPALPAAQRGPTVYIGHLSPECDDVLIRQILQECGRVMRWTRTTDPATKRPSTFGFCEFESPLGVIRAVNCLNNLVIDGQALIANCEDRFKDGLNQWRLARKHKLQEENPSKSMMEIDNDIEREEEKIKIITRKIAADWNARNASANREESTTINPPGNTATPEKPAEETPKEEETSNDLREKWYESLIGFVDLYGTTSLSSKTLNRTRAWNNRIKENRMEFRKKLQNWQRKEPYLAKEFKSFKEHIEKQLNYCENGVNESRMKRLLEYDLKDIPYYLSSEGMILEDVSSRKHYELMEQIRAEKNWDKHDRKLEQEELKKEAITAAEEEERKIEIAAQKLEEEKNNEVEVNEDIVQTENPEKNELEKPVVQPKIEPSVQVADSSTTPPLEESVKESTPVNTSSEKPMNPIVINPPSKTNLNSGGLIKISINTSASKQQQARQNSAIQSPRTNDAAQAFIVVEEEEDKIESVRKHAPLSKLDAPLHRDNKSRLNPEIVMKLASQVPKNAKEVFAFELDWSLFELNNIVQNKVVSWIHRKIVDFLGEEEPELVDFIVSKLDARMKPEELVQELEAFLDEDANGFIVKLWKLLIFEHLRLKEDENKKNKPSE